MLRTACSACERPGDFDAARLVNPIRCGAPACSADGLGRGRTLPPERGCPQPQHVRRVLRLGTSESHCVGEAAAAEDSRALTEFRRLRAGAVPRCTRWLMRCITSLALRGIGGMLLRA